MNYMVQVLFTEYKIQTETGEKKVYPLYNIKKKTHSPKQMETAFLLYNVQESVTECRYGNKTLILIEVINYKTRC